MSVVENSLGLEMCDSVSVPENKKLNEFKYEVGCLILSPERGNR